MQCRMEKKLTSHKPPLDAPLLKVILILSLQVHRAKNPQWKKCWTSFAITAEWLKSINIPLSNQLTCIYPKTKLTARIHMLSLISGIIGFSSFLHSWGNHSIFSKSKPSTLWNSYMCDELRLPFPRISALCLVPNLRAGQGKQVVLPVSHYCSGCLDPCWVKISHLCPELQGSLVSRGKVLVSGMVDPALSCVGKSLSLFRHSYLSLDLRWWFSVRLGVLM